MTEPAFAYNADMRMPDRSPFPTHAHSAPGTLFWIKDVGGNWHEAKIVEAQKNNGHWHKLTGRVRSGDAND